MAEFFHSEDGTALRDLVSVLLDEDRDDNARIIVTWALMRFWSIQVVEPLLQVAWSETTSRKLRSHAAQSVGEKDFRFLWEGPPAALGEPGRFHQPVPPLPPPPGTDPYWSVLETSSPRMLRAVAELRTLSPLPLVAVHYADILEGAGWRKGGQTVTEWEVRTMWASDVAWFRSATLRLSVRATPADPALARLELWAEWVPARWFSQELADPFAEERRPGGNDGGTR